MISIIHENSEILVINKPCGLAVQGGKGINHSLDKDLSIQTGYRIFLVHRLDKDTSGLMIVARNAAAASKWTKLIGSKDVRKEYVAVCIGTLKQKKGIITDDLIQHGQEKTAVTEYQVEKEWSINCTKDGQTTEVFLSRIRLKLQTGRMHQIRIHLAKQNCPIAGDDLHGNFKINKLLKKEAGIKTLQLFSVKLTLPDGKTFELPVE
ncbi:MAG: RNA pseudouridine synthase [Treponema sp.]|nr:RNA pseudouridine synthase [Treponema sp.]